MIDLHLHLDGSLSEQYFLYLAKKDGVDYAIRKDKTQDPPRYIVFFKARDQDTMTMAFREFVSRNDRIKERPSFKKVLEKFKGISMSMDKNREREKTRQKTRGQSL